MSNGQCRLRRSAELAAGLLCVLLGAVGLRAQTSTFPHPPAGPLNLSQTTSTTSSFPELVIDAKGDFNVAWVDSAGTAQGTVFFSRSTAADGGQNFTKVKVATNGAAAFQPQVVVDSSGNNVYVAWAAASTAIPGSFDIFVSHSTNGGGAFPAKPARASLTPMPLVHGPRMAVDSSGLITVVWGRDETDISQSTDGGATFSPPIKLSTPPQNSGGPRVAVDSKGTIYVVWADELHKNDAGSYCLEKDTKNTAVFNNTLGGNVYFNQTAKATTPSARATRNLSNAEWKGLNPKWPMGFFGCSYDNVMLIMDSSDNLHLVWSDDLPDEDILVSAYPVFDSTGAAKFEFPRNLAQSAAASPHAVIDQNKILHVVWSGGPGAPSRGGIFYTHSTDNTPPFGLTFVSQSVVASTAAPTSVPQPEFPQIAIDPSGAINVVWQQAHATGPTTFDSTTFDVSFARSFDQGATFPSRTTVSASPSLQCLNNPSKTPTDIPPPPYTICGSVQMGVDASSNAEIVWVDNAPGKTNSDILFSRGTVSPPPPPPGDFSVTLAIPSQTAPSGGTASYTVNVAAANGFNQPVNLSCSAPAGVTCLFNTATVTPSGTAPVSSTVTVSIPVTLPPQAQPYKVTITGTSDTLHHLVVADLIITAAPDFSITLAPSSQTALQGGSGTYTVNVGSSNNFNSSVTLTCSGVPAGATCTINPPAVTAPNSATVTLAASGTVAPNPYSFTIAGTSGSTTHAQQAQIIVGTLNATISPATSATINVGGSTNFTVSLSSTNGASGPVSLGCAGVAAGLRCTLSPAQVTPPASGSVTTTLTVAVDVKPAGSSVHNGSPDLREITGPYYSAAWSLVLAVLLLMTAAMGMVFRSEDAGPALTTRRLAMLALVLVLAAGLVSCGGTARSSGGGGGGVGGSNPVTTQFALQGQSGTAMLNLSTMSITVP